MSSQSKQQKPSCSLCAGQGCLAQFFGSKKSSSHPIPERVMVVLYGIPLMGLLTGACLGALHSEWASIAGAGLGLCISFCVLRACKWRLNELCLQRKILSSGD